MRLAGRVAVVTGGGNGMGRAYCEGLAAEGARVAVADVDTAAAGAVAAALGADAALAVGVDVTREAPVAGAVEAIVARWGRIDVLVNNAGGGVRPAKPLSDTDLESWNANLALNLTGCFLMCRAVIPVMRGQGYGKIVNVATASVFSGVTVALFRPPESRHNLVPYVAAKAGVVGLTRALAREVGADGIRVNAVAPGYTLTERSRRLMDEGALARVLERQILGRPGAPTDPTGAVVFLASADSDFVTGQTLCVDGGWVAH
jgi:3-oxoacyl-[acyl-carrier protein] reductase